MDSIDVANHLTEMRTAIVGQRKITKAITIFISTSMPQVQTALVLIRATIALDQAMKIVIAADQSKLQAKMKTFAAVNVAFSIAEGAFLKATSSAASIAN